MLVLQEWILNMSNEIQDGSKRYIVVYPSKPDINSGFTATVNTHGGLHWYRWQAEPTAKLYGGWIIEIDLNKKDQI